MIRKKCFENDWITNKHKEVKADQDILQKIKDRNLSGEFRNLNKLKYISPESFYLWAIATKVI